jgi:hypothetical protein
MLAGVFWSPDRRFRVEVWSESSGPVFRVFEDGRELPSRPVTFPDAARLAGCEVGDLVEDGVG